MFCSENIHEKDKFLQSLILSQFIVSNCSDSDGDNDKYENLQQLFVGFIISVVIIAVVVLVDVIMAAGDDIFSISQSTLNVNVFNRQH